MRKQIYILQKALKATHLGCLTKTQPRWVAKQKCNLGGLLFLEVCDILRNEVII